MIPEHFRGLLDDAAVFPPGDAPLPDAVAAYAARRDRWYADLVGAFVVKDVDVASVGRVRRETPLAVVVTGGAGAIAGGLALARKHDLPLAGIEVAVRDLDDPAGAARRIVAAVDAAEDEGLLAEDTMVHVELPQGEHGAGWLAAADVVAERGLRLKFRTGGLAAAAFPSSATLAAWIDAALDRETPFKCTAGLHNALRHTGVDGFEHHGFLNVLLATTALLAGADAVAVLEERDGPVLAAAEPETLLSARRWFTSFGSCSISEPRDDLVALGLLSEGDA